MITSVDIYAVLLLAKKSQFTRFLFFVKFLAQKSGRVKYLTNFKSEPSIEKNTMNLFQRKVLPHP